MWKNSATGTRTRVARVRAEYPNQLDYSGFCFFDIVAMYVIKLRSSRRSSPGRKGEEGKGRQEEKEKEERMRKKQLLSGFLDGLCFLVWLVFCGLAFLGF